MKPTEEDSPQTSWISESQVSGQLDLLEGHNDEASLDQARTEAKAFAYDHRITMAVGWQQNDVTGEDEYGYCPLSVVGPAFVHTVLETIEPN